MLDDLYGDCRAPHLRSNGTSCDDWELNEKPYSFSVLTPAIAVDLAALMARVERDFAISRVLTHDVVLIWVMDAGGRFLFSVEELVYNKQATGLPKHRQHPLLLGAPKLGHPALVAGQPARVGGEIYFDAPSAGASGQWVIRADSGRYSRGRPNSNELCNNVRNYLGKLGIVVVLEPV